MILVLLMFSAGAYPFNADIERLLSKVDSVLACAGEYVAVKEAKIDELRKRRLPDMKPEERLWLNKMLYDEFYISNADSAMVYVNDNINISRELGRKDWKQEWLLNKVFLLSATGLLNEAEKELSKVDVSSLDSGTMYKYYDTRIYLCSHQAQFIGSRRDMISHYQKLEADLRQKAKAHISPDHPSYYSFYAALYKSYPRTAEGDSIKMKLKEIVDNSSNSTLVDAINAYALAVMYNNEGDEANYVRYLAYSAMADLKICNCDIASLEELAGVLYKLGDIDRGYAYINYCLKAALLYPNRVRVMNISAVMDKIQHAYSQRNAMQEGRVRTSLYVVSILSLVLLASLSFIFVQYRKLSRSRKELDETNKQLNLHVAELSDTQRLLAEVNGKLKQANDMLTESNARLLESNYVKEEYIGYVFSICSSYISKLDEYRKNIGRKLKAGQIDDIKSLTSGTTMVQSELKEFYHSFDAIFLHVYPDFVEDFNALLRPEERVTLKEGELLNTELRIYALVRLGISDSVKIAEFLHCSPQTVYNNRLKTRNKAIIPKEEFADRVRSLGKMQR